MPTRGTEPVVSTCRPSTFTGATIDSLETRRLFSANLEVTRTLVIDATPGNDTISVDLDVGLFGERTLRVTENGAVTGRFAEGDVVDILILCGDGNDFVRIGTGGAAGTTHSVTTPDRITGGSVRTPVQIEGGAGNDTLNGGAGNDTIFGGDGDDFIDGYDGNDFVDAGAGNDTVIMDYGADTVFGGPGDDRLNGEETGKGSTIDGGDGNDQITGNSHKDVVHGGAGNDLIDGGPGADRIFGGDGADRITINAKNARIRGEGGADVFLERVSKGRRSLKDFLTGEDSIQPILTPSFTQSPTFSYVKVDDALQDDVADLLV